MSKLLSYLEQFNSKERFFLVRQILGNPKFTLAEDFLKELSDIGLNVPKNAFSAMDYHLDWLYASLYLAENNEESEEFDNLDQIIKGQQEDIDWLIAFEDNDKHHIILIEAKGVTGWSKPQMQSKAERLKNIFNNCLVNIIPHFVIMSPYKPTHEELDDERWVDWMKEPKRKWINLKISEQLFCVQRCDKDKNEYKKWRIVPRKISS